MWMLRSPVVPADQVTAMETRKVANQTGEYVSCVGRMVQGQMSEEHTRYGEKESLDLSISKSLNNAGKEVLECLRENRHVLGEHEEVEAVVCQTQLDALPD